MSIQDEYTTTLVLASTIFEEHLIWDIFDILHSVMLEKDIADVQKKGINQ